MINNIKKIMKYFSFKRFRNNLIFLIKYDIVNYVNDVKDETLEDMVYEYEENKNNLATLCIKSENETLDTLYKTPKSYARFGDGEINIINGNSTGFQKYDERLAKKLKEILNKKHDNLYVGLNRSYFESPIKYSDRNRKYYRLYSTKLRRSLLLNCNKENVYYDACCWGGYFRQNMNYDFDEHYKKIERLFKNKKIVLVYGEGILDEIEFNVLDIANELIKIEAPRTNAFDKYNELIEQIKSYNSSEYLVCIVLGMTATAMAYDLSNLGYVAWDIGHCLADYNAYKKQMIRNDENYDKYLK